VRPLNYGKALFTSPVFSSPKDVEICGNLVFTQYYQIPSNTLPQKILYHDEEYLIAKKILVWKGFVGIF
jgi:hypothetical protein